MKIIYRGGYQTTNAEKSLFYEYAKAIKRFINSGKNVVYVTFAKPDRYYDQRMFESLGILPNIIDNTCENNIDWAAFDLIVIPGGETEILREALIKYGFSLNKLKKDVVVIGDSAGAYVLSKYFFGKKEKEDGTIEYFLVEGLYPKSNLLTIAHIDNTKHMTAEKLSKAQNLAQEIGVKLLMLKENEAVLFEDSIQKDFQIDKLLA